MTTLDAPKLIFGTADVTDPDDILATNLLLSLPALPFQKSSVTIGGDIDADSGARASFAIRYDELMLLTFRFFEIQWTSITHWLDVVMSGQVFIIYPWWPRALGYLVRLDSPSPGSVYTTQSDGEFPRVLLLPIVVRAVNTFDLPDFGDPTIRSSFFGRGPETGKTVDTIYHNVTMTVDGLTVTWPNYVVPGNSDGWQGVIGTGSSSADPQSMLFDRPVKRVYVEFAENTFYGNQMVAYDQFGTEVGRCVLDGTWIFAHGAIAIIDLPTNVIRSVTMVPNDDWITYRNIQIDRFVYTS